MKSTSTDSAPVEERLDFWRDAISRAFVKLDFDPVKLNGGRQFSGRITQSDLADIELAVVNSNGQHVRRTSRLIRQTQDELFLVSFQLAGEGEVRQDGRRAVLAAGDFVIYDSTRPYELVFREDFEQLVVTVPRDRLRVRAPSAERLTAIAIRGSQGIGRLLGELVVGLTEHAEAMAGQTQASVSNAVLDLVATALATLPASQVGSLPTLKLFHLNRIKSYIHEHLSDPDLSIISISEALGVSVSSMYRVFEAERCSLAEWIWDQRLQACRATLLDVACSGLSIKQIAMSWGFNDPAHFSRAFRRRFGQSPAAFRSRE